ncbi:MAG: glyoxalase, partial [Okeania sp. SIO2D1]|nr:glyoxalase [Okeania sp. SIO2D1]
MNPIFHLAIPINNIAQAKAYYVEGLGCQVGRENAQALILNFYSHQVVAHMTKEPLT